MLVVKDSGLLWVAVLGHIWSPPRWWFCFSKENVSPRNDLVLKFVSNIEECCEFLPPEADLTLCFALYLRKLNCPIQPHPISRDFSLTLQEALTVVPSGVLKPSPGWTKTDFLVSEWEEIKRKSFPGSLWFFYCLKFACNHPWMFHVSGDFVSSGLDIHNTDNSASHLGSSSRLWKHTEDSRAQCQMSKICQQIQNTSFSPLLR